MNSFRLGIFAEFIISWTYRFYFYKILHTRYKTPVGEIDLIATRGKFLTFIEVKARKRGIYDGIVTETQKQRIRNAAKLFLSKNPKYEGYDIRFDFAVVQPYKLPLIIKNAW